MFLLFSYVSFVHLCLWTRVYGILFFSGCDATATARAVTAEPQS